MYVVINIDPGNTLNELMAFMTRKTITFSVTDQLSRLCDKTIPGRREASTQTQKPNGTTDGSPPTKKARVCKEDDCGSPCSSATPSEPTDSKRSAENGQNVEFDPVVLRDWMISSEMRRVKEEPEEASAEDEMSSVYVHDQLMALFSNNKNDNDPEEDTDKNGDATEEKAMSFGMESSPSTAIRYKPAYASTKRGVCHVCNREVSLITTHRRRHAITHLGFKTLKCALCYKFFSRQDLATGHFKKDHPDAAFTPFVDTMSEEDEQQLVVMLNLCFPEEHLRKRAKDGEAKSDVSPTNVS